MITFINPIKQKTFQYFGAIIYMIFYKVPSIFIQKMSFFLILIKSLDAQIKDSINKYFSFFLLHISVLTIRFLKLNTYVKITHLG